jgi:hypothetical protein
MTFAARDTLSASGPRPDTAARGPAAAPAPSPLSPNREAAGADAENARDGADGGLLVEEDAPTVLPGQMRKAAFLEMLRADACAAADRAMAARGRSTEGCPLVERLLGQYAARDARHLERAIRRYAPEARGAAAAADYVPVVSARLAHGAATWAETGQLPDVPDELRAEAGLGGLGGVGAAVAGAVRGAFAAIGRLFRSTAAGAGEADAGAAPQPDHAALAVRLGPGEPIEAGARRRLEGALGHNFAHVRVHADATADGMARAAEAQAFTVGAHVAFGAGSYRPGSLAGDALLAHELAHVVQQQAGPGPGAPPAAAATPALEAEADEAAAAALWSVHAGAGPEPRMRAGPGPGAGRRPRRGAAGGLRLQRCGARQTPVTSTLPAMPQTGPLVAGMRWRVDHADVTSGDAAHLLGDAVQALVGGERGAVDTFVARLAGGPTWTAKSGVYVRALDFLRDNRGLFDVMDWWDTVNRAVAFCDGRPESGAARLDDAFYSALLVSAVYSPGAGTATVSHRSGGTYGIAGRQAGATDYAPSGRDTLVRPYPWQPVDATGGLPAGVDLLRGYGAQQGTVSAADAGALIQRNAARVPERVRSHLIELAQDSNIHGVLRSFLETDGGRFFIMSDGTAHYSRGHPPQIEVGAGTIPGSGVRGPSNTSERTPIQFRGNLMHELAHYAFDRADTMVGEIQTGFAGPDHPMIYLLEERYEVIQTLLAGEDLLDADAQALTGWVGADFRDTLRGHIARNDVSAFRTLASAAQTFDNMALRGIWGVASDQGPRLQSGDVRPYLFDPAQQNDLLYYAAVNAMLVKRGLEITADVAGETGTPLSGIWRSGGTAPNATYLRRVRTFVDGFMGAVRQNRTTGVSALAARL